MHFHFHPPRLGFVLRTMIVTTVAVMIVGLLYGVHLDRIVRNKFEGKRWALPARVYARPLELYVGRVLTPATFIGELQRIKYRTTPTTPHPGTYQQQGEQITFHTHGFQFWDGTEPPLLLTVRFANNVITELRDATTNQEVALVRLEPALIANIYPTHNEDRVLLTRRQLPDLLIKTLLAVEDRNFYQHVGLDPKGIARAAYKNVLAGRTVEGASTLTQQLVKNFYLTQQRTLERKFNEAYMALLLERRYSKDEILTAYTNEIYMGQDGNRAIHGFGLASQFYFDRPLAELRSADIALLVAMIKGPSEFNPRRHPEKALARRNLVLDLMVYYQIISPAEGEIAKATALGVHDGGGRPVGDYPAFIQLVRRQLQRDYREEDLRSEGLRIFTTLDPLIQSHAEQVMKRELTAIEQRQQLPLGELETAMVMTSVAQGEVLALVGARKPGYQGFNRALDAVRSIGSLIKPVIYLTALAQPERYSLVTKLDDQPVKLRIGGELWQPQNYDHRSHGAVPLYRALAKSYNLATVNLGLELGIDQIAQTLNQLGALREIRPVPAMLLGSVSLTPIELAQVYQTIAAGGFRAPLRAIRDVQDAAGQPLNRYPLAIESVVSPAAAYLTQWALRRVVAEGTATWLQQRLPSGLTVAGKTGTTNELRDSWFAGFSGDKVAVIWVGYDNNQPTRLTGSTGALRLWGELMAELDHQPLGEVMPDGVELASVCGYDQPVPFVSAHAGVGVNCGSASKPRPASRERDGADAAARDNAPRDAAADDEVVTPPPPAPITPPPPRRAAPPEENAFMRDFYDR
ncbi:penicillin-binding protein 1B [Thiospirillum jenense]|uniref:Penicillin-binding protein 1B n=1 Tax=Thiospirillum jenense TaxID=1653858 RepID=A0A839HJF1_9GAMM|nr:penicillin-binding protein 1B [Thiospirillum jenense]MBB1126948.1 penicillin-binding protein 1B [Thiospirillum jenense]